MHFAIDQHVNWIARCIDDMKSGGHTAIDAEMNAATEWVGFVSRVAEQTWPDADSWYLGANIPGKPRIFLPLVGCELPFPERALGQNAVQSIGWKRVGTAQSLTVCHALCLADPHYVKKCEEVVAAGYEGFTLLAENRARI